MRILVGFALVLVSVCESSAQSHSARDTARVIVIEVLSKDAGMAVSERDGFADCLSGLLLGSGVDALNAASNTQEREQVMAGLADQRRLIMCDLAASQ